MSLWSFLAVVLMVGAAGAPATADAARAVAVSPEPEVPVTPVDLFADADRANNSPVLAASPDGRVVAMANRVDAPAFGCALHLSHDGGRGWVPAQPVTAVPAPAERCYAPELGFDRKGTLYFLFVGLEGRGNVPVGVFLTTSSDGGRRFSRPRQVLGANAFQVRMVIDPDATGPGRVHLVWVQANGVPPLGGFPLPPNPIVTAHSDDGGKTFSPPVQVSDAERSRVVGPAVALGPDNVLHVLYYDLRDDVIDYRGLEGTVWDGTWEIVHSSSGDGGRTFSRGVVVDDAVVPIERVLLIFTMPPPALALDGEGRLVAAWPDRRHGDADVLSRRSLDAGRSWDAPVRLNDDGVGNGRRQYLPRLSAAPNGRVDAIFYDRRADGDNLRNDVFFTHSSDHGSSWAPNVRVTTDSSLSSVGPTYPIPSAKDLVEFGSRLALLSSDRRTVAAWTDTRNAPRNGRGQDVFATTITLGDVAPRPHPLRKALA